MLTSGTKMRLPASPHSNNRKRVWADRREAVHKLLGHQVANPQKCGLFCFNTICFI